MSELIWTETKMDWGGVCHYATAENGTAVSVYDYKFRPLLWAAFRSAGPEIVTGTADTVEAAKTEAARETR